MAIQIPETRRSLSDDYAKLGGWIGLTTGDPGDASAPDHEPPTGPQQVYARQQTNWIHGSNGDVKCQVVVNAPAGTYTHMILCKEQTGDNMIDNCTITNATLNADGQILVAAQYKQS